MDDTTDVEEILVTAQKRAERLQDAPVAVTAVTGDALARANINDTANLVAAVPSLSFQQGNNPTNTSFRIRGIGTSLFSQGVEASVLVVVDGVVAARQAQNFTDFADIERVEVLRGPQGTLFGKNATAGVINVVTARPSDAFGGRASVTIAEGDEYRVSGTVTGPLSDTLAGRLTGFYNTVGGISKNLGKGGDSNGSESWGVRGKLLWSPTDTLDVLFSADYRESDADCCQGSPLVLTTPGLATLYRPLIPSRNNNDVRDDGLTYARSDQQTYSLEANWQLSHGALTAITAYQDYNLINNFEADRLYNPVPIYVGATGGNAYAQFNLNEGTTGVRQFTQEVRFTSPSGQRLTYVVGAFYSDVSLDRDFRRRRAYCAAGTAAQLGTPCTPTSWQSNAVTAHQDAKHIAAFGQAEFELVDKLKLIGGLRVQREEFTVSGQTLGPFVPGDVAFGAARDARGSTSASDDAVTGKAGLQYLFSRNAQAYATYTRGYKGLGFETEFGVPFGNADVLRPENVDAYEVGFKGRLFDGRLTLNAAIFLAQYTDLQVQANRSDPATGTVRYQQVNAGESESKGFELEAMLRPTENFSLNAAITYSDATIEVDGLNCPLQLQAAAPVVALGAARPINACYRPQTRNAAGAIVTGSPIQDVRDGDLPASPKWRAVLTPRYTFTLNEDWNGALQANVAYQSAQQMALEQDPLLKQGAYTIVDASVTLSRADDRYSLSLFVRNLFDQNYYTQFGHGSTLSSTVQATDLFAFSPKDARRFFGVTLGSRF